MAMDNYRIGWIPGADNPADSLIKPVLSTKSPMYTIITCNRL